MSIFKEKRVDRIEVYKMLLSELERYSNIFEKDRKDNFENEYFRTSVQCHIEDLQNVIEELQNDKSWKIRKTKRAKLLKIRES